MKIVFLIVSNLWAGAPTDFVDLKKFDFSIKQEIHYATEKNVLKKKLYASPECYLRKPVAEALSRVQNSLKMQGLGLKVYDCYRPLHVQKLLWEKMPDEKYVVSPEKGANNNRGAGVDLTLVGRNGEEIEMPSDFDTFTSKSSLTFKKLSKPALRNRTLLQKAMAKEGFIPNPDVWWHFDFKDASSYPILDLTFEDLK